MTGAPLPLRKPRRHAWTAAQIAVVRERYPDTDSAQLAAELGVSLVQLRDRAWALGIKKSKAYLSAISRAKAVGIETRFKPGQVPFNKGLKGWKSGGRSVETQFGKGHRPASWKPIGSERLSKEGYLQRKLTDTGYPPRDWVPVHHIVWRDAGREIPPGHRVAFKDGNKTNITLDNLELVTFAELMRRNTHHNYGPELAAVVQLRGALTRQINKFNRKEQPSCQPT